MESNKCIIDSTCEFVNFDESLLLNNCRHAAHCIIYSRNTYPTVETYESKAFILMQMRFDGRFGFPGGIVEQDKSSDCLKMSDIVDGLNRELKEEINLDSKYFVCGENYCSTNISRDKRWCFHMFSKEVSAEDFMNIEKNSLNAEDFGKEVLGSIRVPVFTMKDNFSGFPAFLSNNFAGSARSQLLNFLLTSKLSSYEYIMESLSQSNIK